MKNTPGPWAATTRKGSWDWVVFKEDELNIEICQMFHDGTELNDTGKANSQLVAAAPDLLIVSQSVLMLKQLGGVLPGSREIIQSIVAMAEKAIAKAQKI